MLTDCDVSAVKLLLYYIVTHKIVDVSATSEAMTAMSEEKKEFTAASQRQLIGLWILADKLLVPAR